MPRPRIIVTLDTGEEQRRGVALPSVHMKAAYARQIEQAGGTPLLAAPTDDREVLEDLSRIMDGLLVTGGAFDIAPEVYGRALRSDVRLDQPKPRRTAFETALLEAALSRRVPVFGVCGGMQLLNVVLGGTLVQDIAAEVPGALEHEQATSPQIAHHDVTILPDTAFQRLLSRDVIRVNSTHHQAVAALGRGLVALGRSSDGVVEAIGRPNDLGVIGVQWHPELLADAVSEALYSAFIIEARRLADHHR
jgi:putative glutamine amidotransferase